MAVRYISTEGRLIEDIDTYLKDKGESKDNEDLFKILFKQFSQANVKPLDEPQNAIICNSLSLLFDIYPPLPILRWLNKAFYDGYLDNLNDKEKDRLSIEELLGLGIVGMSVKEQIMDERDLRIALMYHNFRLNKVGSSTLPRKAVADIVIERCEKNPSLLGHPVHQALGCPNSERGIKRIYSDMKKKYPSKFINVEIDSKNIYINYSQ